MEQNIYYQFNNRGDVIALTDASGQIVVKYDYDTWGNMSILSDTTPDHAFTLLGSRGFVILEYTSFVLCQ